VELHAIRSCPKTGDMIADMTARGLAQVGRAVWPALTLKYVSTTPAAAAMLQQQEGGQVGTMRFGAAEG